MNNLSYLRKIFNQCWTDEGFKKQLIKEPILTIGNYLGEPVRVQAGKTIVVEDQTNDSIIYLNIPAEPNLDEIELSEEQLEIVAGGATPATAILVTVCFTAGLAIGFSRD